MQKLAIHKSLLRSHTFLGCDRELCMFLIVIAIIIALTNLSKESFSIAIIFFLTGFLFFKKHGQKRHYAAQGLSALSEICPSICSSGSQL